MDLGFLRPVYEGGTGYVSVYIDTPATETAAREVSLRWRAARERLAEAGADAATLDVIGAAVAERGRGPYCFTALARAGALLLTWTLPSGSGYEISEFAPLPRVVPLLADIPRHAPHVRIAADRAGGEVLIVSAAGTMTRADVRGESWPVHKVFTGGWSKARLQRSAEETWAENARQTAEAAATAAERARARFIIIGGDARERTMVLDLLPTALRDTAVLVDREVAPESAVFAAAAQAEAVRQAAAESGARAEEFRFRMNAPPGRSRRAVEGLDGTLAALRAGLVSDLLLADDPASAGDPASAAKAWIGPKPADAAVTKEQLTDRGITALGTDRADEVLVRAAAGTGASLFFIPPDAGRPRDGVGALLRAPIAATMFGEGASG
jgi:hypothetical protein